MRSGALGRSPNALYLEAPDLHAFYERVQGRAVQIVDRPWGQAELTVEDADGNWLTFWRKLSGA